MIRKINKEDITKVMNLWIRGNFQGNYFIEKDYWLEIFNTTKDLFFNIYITYVYEENNNILGFISFYKNEIKAIAIDKSSRRKGIGRKLINFCQEKNKNADNLIVMVFEKNIPAFLFFSGMGFRIAKININKKFQEKEYIMESK